MDLKVFMGLFLISKSHLYSAVAPVGYDDVSVCVHGHSGGSVELAVAFAMGAKFEQELSVCVVNLKTGHDADKRNHTRCLRNL